jgi:adenylate cyclase
MLKLIHDPGGPNERSFNLRSGPNTIGRAPDNAVAIASESLSRRHACLIVEQECVRLSDLRSKNGTFVGGKRIRESQLASGGTFVCGDVSFTLADDDDEPVSSARPVLELDIEDSPHIHDLLHGAGLGAACLDHESHEEGQHSRERLRLLLRVCEELSAPGELESLLKKILDLMFQILLVDHAAIFLAERDAKTLTLQASRSPEGAGHLAFSRHVVDHVQARGKAALFSDASDDARLLGATSISLQSIRASMCVPLRRRDQPVGILYVDNRSRSHPFNGADLDFLCAFAGYAAIAIDNALLLRRVEQDATTRTNLLRFFPPSTAHQILAGGRATLHTNKCEVTVLFCDLCGYTALSSTMDPSAIIELLNDYFRAMSAVVFRFEGTLEKYIGDALLAVWGAPFSHADDAARAVEAAIEMQRSLQSLNHERQQRGDQPLPKIHIGIDSGIVAAGNIGSERYLQYATIGDATNLASRICGQSGPGEILISERTLARIRDKDWRCVARPPTEVKGKDAPLTLYSVHWSTPKLADVRAEDSTTRPSR